MVKRLPTMRDTSVQSLGREDLLEKEMVTHSSILAGKSHGLRSLVGFQLSSVQFLSCLRLFVTPWTAAHQASLSITNSRSLLKLMSIESVMPSIKLVMMMLHGALCYIIQCPEMAGILTSILRSFYHIL